jgi:hypothetical protein
MFKDLLRQEEITIYRLQDLIGYDFSSSEEGEVSEEWRTVKNGVKARFRWEDGSFSRRADGIVDVGTHVCYVDANIDIRNVDRIYRPVGEDGPNFFSVRMVKTVRDRHWKIHHKEIHLDNIDWTIGSSYIGPWIQPPPFPNVAIIATEFDYLTTTKTILTTWHGIRLYSISVQTNIEFDDLLSTIVVSDSDGDILESSAVDLSFVGFVREEVMLEIYTDEQNIILTVNPGDSTQGSGILFMGVILP